MIDFDAQANLADLRRRVLNGEQLTATEYRDLLLDLRRGRDMAAAAQSAQRSKAAREARQASKKPAKPLDLDALFNGGSTSE